MLLEYVTTLTASFHKFSLKVYAHTHIIWCTHATTCMYLRDTPYIIVKTKSFILSFLFFLKKFSMGMFQLYFWPAYAFTIIEITS